MFFTFHCNNYNDILVEFKYKMEEEFRRKFIQISLYSLGSTPLTHRSHLLPVEERIAHGFNRGQRNLSVN